MKSTTIKSTTAKSTTTTINEKNNTPNKTKSEQELIAQIESSQIKSAEEVYFEDLINRHAKHIASAKSGYIRDVTYEESMEIHRYIEKRLNRNIPLNHSCSTCVLDMYLLFIKLTL